MTKISLITIGNELLKGTIINTNAARAGTMLRESGFHLGRVVTIADQAEDIQQTVEQEFGHSEVILMSGGLGPTQDDITKQTLKESFGGGGYVLHEPTLAHLRERYRKRGRALNELTEQQAMVPDVCEVVRNELGTAPGMLFRRGEKMLISMPGVPFEMLHMLQNEVIPLLQRERSPNAFLREVVRITGVPESEAAQRMEALEKEAPFPPEIEVAYLPRVDGLWLEIATQLPIEQKNIAAELASTTSDRVYRQFQKEAYTRTTKDLALIVQEAFMEKGLTLAVAESMTGGMVAAKLVSISGASRYFKGGVTAYFTEVKSKVLGVSPEIIEKYGVVSEAVAQSMAEGVRQLMGADVGLAITGRAEPAENLPAEAWLGYATAKKSMTKHIDFLYRRNVNIERASNILLLTGLANIRSDF